MKNLFLAVFTLVVISISSANAQVVFGARVGASIPTIYETGGNSNGKFGVEAGPVLYYTIKHNLYINTGVMFSYKTFDFDGSSLNMSYLDVPLYLGYNFATGSAVSFYAQIGPYVGFKLSEKSKFSDGSSESTKFVKNFDAGAAIMGGVNIQRFKIEVGYKHGFLNLYNVPYFSDLGVDVGSDKLNLGSFFLGVSYVF